MSDGDQYEAYQPPSRPEGEPDPPPAPSYEAYDPVDHQHLTPLSQMPVYPPTPTGTPAYHPSSYQAPTYTASRRRRRLPTRLVFVILAISVPSALRVLHSVDGSSSVPDISIPNISVPDTGGDSGLARAVRHQLEVKLTKYESVLKHDDYASIGLKDTPFNRLGVAAYTFFLTDMVSATNFGVTAKEAGKYLADSDRYEKLLRAGIPLGDNIDITFGPHRAFRYDGKTGKGGYVDPTKVGPSRGRAS
ncbi:hypothetical protein [Nocardioides montaniterrae]